MHGKQMWTAEKGPKLQYPAVSPQTICFMLSNDNTA